MAKNYLKLYFGLVFIGLMLLAAHRVEHLYPTHFPQPVYAKELNQLTEAKVQLGRALFYDPILSADSTISCASCHSPFNAFALTDHDLSHGIGDAIGTRNAPALFNLAWHSSLMWDGAIAHLDMQALAPISHPKEMNETIAHICEKLRKKKMYSQLFHEAFQDSAITGTQTLKALSAFQLTLISAGAKYDQVILGRDTFNVQEQSGYALFKHHCNTCHSEPLFTNHQFANNGLPIDSSLRDAGRANITHLKSDSLLFKVPSLRNLSYSYPYMHDGRFKKLHQVLKHYTNGVIEHPTLAPELKGGLKLSSTERTDLIAFLLTLNDKTFVFDTAHQFPKNLLLKGEGNK